MSIGIIDHEEQIPVQTGLVGHPSHNLSSVPLRDLWEAFSYQKIKQDEIQVHCNEL